MPLPGAPGRWRWRRWSPTLRGGYLAPYLGTLVAQLQGGVWFGTLYWLIWWLALVCAAIPAWELVRFIVHNGPIHFHHTQSCSAHDAFRIFVLV